MDIRDLALIHAIAAIGQKQDEKDFEDAKRRAEMNG
jgi:hypothetical protein